MSSEMDTVLSRRAGEPVVDWLVQAAMTHGMNSIGAERGLSPLAWTAINEDGGILEGRAPEGTACPLGLCEAWATALGFTEYSYDLGTGIRTWYLEHSSWHVEITTDNGQQWLDELNDA